jgi:putative ATP-dependent endonuclease of OLD family
VTASHSNHAASRNVETDQLIELVERHYLDITEQSGTDPAELEKGFAAARALLLQMPFNAASASLGPVLQEITGAHRRQPSTAGPPRFHGGAAEKIGLLLLMGAVLRTGQFGLTEGAAPLVIVEDPEAHLHPMTLASVWGLLEQIRWQKIVSTHSGTLLSNAPLSSIHRLTREQGVVLDWSVAAGRLSKEELRRWGYHIRSRRASAMFARCWLFVEGETEFWLLPEFARILGFDLAVEGIPCVEFAQSGLSALIKVAENLGIEWHMLADGDEAGQRYRQIAQPFMDPGQVDERITIIPERDIEHCLWHNGFAHVYRRAAYPQARRIAAGSPESVISLAISRTSKPYLALQVLEAASALGPEKVPAPIRHAVSSCIMLARHSPLVPDSLLPE